MESLEEPPLPAHIEALLDELTEGTRQAITTLWEKYEAGDYPPATSAVPESGLEILTGCDILVDQPRDGLTNEIYDLEVRNFGAKDRIGNNFMGHAVYSKCVAFRGEMRFAKTALNTAFALMKDSARESVMKRGSEVKFPNEGLVSGLSYEEFSARVEIVEWAIYLKESRDKEDSNAEDNVLTILSVSKNGEQLEVPAPEDTQYDADIGSESGESRTNHEFADANEVEEVLGNTGEISDLPRINVYPPSIDRPRTEYLRPTSWSPLTEEDEEHVPLECGTTATLPYKNIANAELDTTKGDVAVSVAQGLHDPENVSEHVGRVVSLRHNEEEQDALEEGADEDQIITDGSLFGGPTPEHDNEGDTVMSAVNVDIASTDQELGHPANPSTVGVIMDSQGDVRAIDVSFLGTPAGEANNELHIARTAPQELCPESEGVQNTESKSTLTHESEGKDAEITGDPKSVQPSHPGPQTQGSCNDETNGHFAQISKVQSHGEEELLQQPPTVKLDGSSSEKAREHSSALNQDDGPSKDGALCVANEQGTVVAAGLSQKETNCAMQRDENEEPTYELPTQSETRTTETKLDSEHAQNSGREHTDCKRDHIEPRSTATDQVDNGQPSGLDVLAKAAVSESKMATQGNPGPADGRSYRQRTTNNTIIVPIHGATEKSVQGSQHSGKEAASVSDRLPKVANASGEGTSGSTPTAVGDGRTAEILECVITTSNSPTPPNVQPTEMAESTMPEITSNFDFSQVQAESDSQPRLVSPLAPSEDGTDPLALSDEENEKSTQQLGVNQLSYEGDAALAAQLAEEARRYPTRKRSMIQDVQTLPPAKKQAVQAPARKKLSTRKSEGIEAATPQTPLPVLETATTKGSMTKKLKTFREGTRKQPRRSIADSTIKYKE